MEVVEVYRCRSVFYNRYHKPPTIMDRYFSTQQEALDYMKQREDESGPNTNRKASVEAISLLKINGKHYPLPDAVSADEISF